MGGRRTLLLCCIAVMSAVGQPPAPASPQPDPALWLIGADGTGGREVDEDVDRGFGYDWSPDGSFLTYGTGDIWVLDVARGEAVNVTGTPAAHEVQPSWSPDGRRLAFARGADVWTMDPDGTDPLRLTDDDTFEMAPSWSPAGDLIAFVRFDRDGRYQRLEVIGAGGGESVALGDIAGHMDPPSWSPDGREIVYTSPLQDVRVVDVVTGSTSVLAERGFSPEWAPSGDRIAYGNYDGLFVVSRDGTTKLRLDETALDPFGDLSWSPDGSSIAIGGYEIQVVDAATGSAVALTTGQPTEEEHAPLWSPTGDLIAYVGEVWCCLPHFWDRQIEAGTSGHLVMEGRLHSGLDACAREVRVNVQKRDDGDWRTIRRGTATGAGAFRIRVPDRPGRYRVVTPKERVEADGSDYTCLRSKSGAVTHRH